jgi:sialate O-acetylesterase
MLHALSVVVAVLAAAIAFAPGAAAQNQKLPKQDVVDVPAIQDGLCLSNVFQSHMVLQRDKPIRIWGWAAPGEPVAVAFGGDRKSVRAEADRSWSVTLQAQPANATPQQLVVQGLSATVTLDDVLVGDVWLLGGQSNMEFELDKVENGALEIVSANYPQIRVLTVPYGIGPEPVRGFARLHEWSDWFGRHFRKGDWDPCTPKIARELSAIGYVFARRVHMAAQVPIGVVDVSRGGTTAESWTPLAKLRALPDAAVKAKLAEWDQKVAQWDAEKDLAQRVRQNREWVEKQTAAGKPVPDDRKQDPTDLRAGPIGDVNHPGHSFAGMIAPLLGLSIKGVIWHQGYNNALDGMPGVVLYRAVLPEMVRAWREAFGDPALPFGILSQCTEGTPQTRDDYCEKMLDTGIYIREAHYRTFLDLWRAGDTHIGYASTYDLRRKWYHPQVKIPAGERIARWALASEYGFGRELQWKPPMVQGHEPQDGALVLRFDDEVGDPEEGAIAGFAIAGDDRHFHPADAAYREVGKDDRGQPRVDRRQLVLTSPLVPEPKHYRYGWGRSPLANVQAIGNKDLPLATQRSDDWAIGEVPRDVLGAGVDGSGALSRQQWNRVREALKQDDVRRRVAEAKATLAKFGDAAEGAADKLPGKKVDAPRK